jgi:hypothetical protein
LKLKVILIGKAQQVEAEARTGFVLEKALAA